MIASAVSTRKSRRHSSIREVSDGLQQRIRDHAAGIPESETPGDADAEVSVAVQNGFGPTRFSAKIIEHRKELEDLRGNLDCAIQFLG